MLRALPVRLSPPSRSVCTCSQPPHRTCPPRSLRCLAGGCPQPPPRSSHRPLQRPRGSARMVVPSVLLPSVCSRPGSALPESCCRWSRFLLHSSADGCCSSLPAVSLAHACCCAPVRTGAHALLPPILLACAPTGSGLTVSSCSRSLAPPGACQCHAQLTGVGTRSWGEEGLLRGLRLFAVDVTIRLGLSLAHSFWAQACSLSLWGSPVLIPGSCSLAVVLGLTLTRLLLCWCTHMAHIEVFTPFGCGSSSSS